MIHAASAKSVVMLKPQSVATNATVTGTVDTLGFDHCRVDVLLDSQTSTTSKPTALKLEESNDLTTYVTVSPFTGGTGFTIPTAGSVSTVIRFNVDLRPRMRYLKVSLTAGDAAQLACVHANLSRAEVLPNTATLKGCTAVVDG